MKMTDSEGKFMFSFAILLQFCYIYFEKKKGEIDIIG